MRGTTEEQFRDGDISHLFRKQNNRSLDEVDQLLQRQEYLRQQLGDEKADQIEKTPDLFYNHDKFRQWQAKARFRAAIATLITVPVLSTVANGGKNGAALLKKHW